jgi:1-acyl-sn-glycerol-3-phosphate acyltransferase
MGWGYATGMGRKVIAALRTAVAVPTFFLFSLGLSAYVIVVAFIRPHHPHIDRVIQFWSRRFLSVAPMTMEVEGRERLDLDTQYLFVSNHLSNFDIPVLFLAIPHRIRYMAKAELYKIPLVAQAMHRIGIIKIDRTAGKTAHAGINKGVRAAKDAGYSLIVFPEGTRARDNELHPFKKGAFRIAITNGLPVVPIAIDGTWEVWRPDAKMFFPGHARVVIHDPIPVEGLELADIDDLRGRTHDVIGKTYEKLHTDRSQNR